MTTDKTDNEPKAAAFRHYPAMSLPAALDAAKSIYTNDKRTVLNYEAVARSMGNASLSGPARVKIAALRKYGLLEPVGDGLQISQLAMRLLHQPESSEDYKVALKESALRPELFKKLFDTHLDASHDAVVSHLIVRLQFPDAGAKAAAKAFRETISFAKLDQAVYTSSNEADKTEAEKEASKAKQPKTATPLAGDPPKKTDMDATLNSGELQISIAGKMVPIPFPMSEDEFELFIGTLNLWKKKLVRKLTPIPPSVPLPANAMWEQSNGSHKPVKIVALMGEKDGEQYYQSEDGTGLPASQLKF